MQAAEEGLTIEYQSPNLAKVHDWAKKQWEQSKHRAVGVYAGALGFGYNTELLQKIGGAEPKCSERVLPAGVRISNFRALDRLADLQISLLSSRYIADHCGSALRTGRKPFGRIEMAKAPERKQRRHVREKATIDHLVQDVYKPKPAGEKHPEYSPTTSNGSPVEGQVRKEWDPRKGGLPVF